MGARFFYGAGFDERYRAAADNIPPSSEVLDVCSGDCYIYEKYLKSKNVRYLGVDSSRGFRKSAWRKNIPFRLLDLRCDDIPAADYVVMLASFYQFYDMRENVLDKLLGGARKRLIIVEPVLNIAQSKSFLAAKLAKVLTGSNERFDQAGFISLIESRKSLIEKIEAVNHGREMMVVFDTEKPV